MEEGFLQSTSTQGKTLMIYSICGKGAPTRYGGRNPQSQQWYRQQQQSFQKSRKGKDKKLYNQQEWNKQ